MMQEPRDLSGRPQQAGTATGQGLIEIDPDVARLGGMEAKQQPAAANAPIQGSSADIIKLATVQLQKNAASGTPGSTAAAGPRRTVLEVSPDALEATKSLIVKTMENAVNLSVPIVAKTGTGSNCMEAK